MFSHSHTDFVIERKSDSSYMCQERPASTDDTLLCSCLLPTSLTLVFYHLKLTENRKREGKDDCRQAPEAATEHCLANKNKLIHKVLTVLRAVVFMKGNKWNKRYELLLYNAHESFSLSQRLSCCHPVIWALCIPR